MRTTYYRGDKAKLTGRSEVIAGQTFNEIELLEGECRGEKKLVLSDDDKAANSARTIADWKEQQAAFSRIRQAQK